MAWITGAFQRQSKNVSFWNVCFHLRIISASLLFFPLSFLLIRTNLPSKICLRWKGGCHSGDRHLERSHVGSTVTHAWGSQPDPLQGRLQHVLRLGRLCVGQRRDFPVFRSLSLRRPHLDARWLRSRGMCDEKRWLHFGENSAWCRRESILFPPGRVASHCLIPGPRNRRPEEVVRPRSHSGFDRWCYKSSLTDFGNSGGRKGSRASTARSSWWQLPEG